VNGRFLLHFPRPFRSRRITTATCRYAWCLPNNNSMRWSHGSGANSTDSQNKCGSFTNSPIGNALHVATGPRPSRRETQNDLALRARHLSRMRSIGPRRKEHHTDAGVSTRREIFRRRRAPTKRISFPHSLKMEGKESQPVTPCPLALCDIAGQGRCEPGR
jgi:hypothetical protein